MEEWYIKNLLVRAGVDEDRKKDYLGIYEESPGRISSILIFDRKKRQFGWKIEDLEVMAHSLRELRLLGGRLVKTEPDKFEIHKNCQMYGACLLK